MVFGVGFFQVRESQFHSAILI